MVKRPDADISHHGPHEHNRQPVAHTAWPRVGNLRLHRTKPNSHHHTRKQYLETKSHWHCPELENCPFLHIVKVELKFGYHKEPRTGGYVLEPGNFKFKPGYWTSWSRTPGSKERKNTGVLFIVQDEGLCRNRRREILRFTYEPHRSGYAVSSPR